MKLTRDYCDHCKRDVPALYNQPSHLLHLLLCISTAGLWAPIWIYYTFIATNNCIRCGSKTTAPNMPGRFIAILLWILLAVAIYVYFTSSDRATFFQVFRWELNNVSDKVTNNSRLLI